VTLVENAASLAVVIGATGGIGHGLLHALRAGGSWSTVIGLSRSGDSPIDIIDEASVAAAASAVDRHELPLRLVIHAAGTLDQQGCRAEKTWRHIDPVAMQRAFAINSIGPALVMKHFLPRLARDGRSVFAALSARVGSIGDNRLGGWYSYRASKAALNQLVRTAAIELRRSHPHAVCVAIHPGTVTTKLTADHDTGRLHVQAPEEAATRILAVLSRLDAGHSGQFLDQRGDTVQW
jgi:NAD(P)-dependent dehydrogenase (short-subunit alcohol dehydrogenase family)